MNVLIQTRYGAKIDAHMTRTGQDIMPLVHSYAANAIERRLTKKNRQADAEGSGPFSVKWSGSSSLFVWFLPEEIKELDEALGTTGTRSYRTQAPTGVVRGNLSQGRTVPVGDLGGIPLENYWIDGGNVD